MKKHNIGALLLGGVILLSAGYGLRSHFRPKPVFLQPEEAQLVQVQKVIDQAQQPTVDYEITEALEAELIDYFSGVNHRATMRKAGSYHMGDYAYLMVFWSGEEFIQIRLSDNGVTHSSGGGRRLYAIEHAPQVLADVEALLKDAVLTAPQQ